MRWGRAVPKVTRARVIARDQSTCQLCRRKLTAAEVTLDHIVPRADGGGNGARNLRVACVKCNHDRHRPAPGTFPPLGRAPSAKRRANWERERQLYLAAQARRQARDVPAGGGAE